MVYFSGKVDKMDKEYMFIYTFTYTFCVTVVLFDVLVSKRISSEIFNTLTSHLIDDCETTVNV